MFTGAGVSAGSPSTLPLARQITGSLVAECRGAAAALIGVQQLPATLPPWPMEAVLGRIRGTVGEYALDVLQCLVVDMPNRDHLLLALHLLGGGLQITVNLDEGVERAIALLRGDIPATPIVAPHLAAWQALLPSSLPKVTVARTTAEFEAWLHDGGPRPALLKLHGSLDGTGYVDPVVEDEPELMQLSSAKLAAIAEIARCEQVLVTGYAGLDIDVYETVIQHLPHHRFTWACLGQADARLVDDIQRHQGVARFGASGAATANIADLLEITTVPAWPDAPNPAPALALKQWLSEFASRKNECAEVYAWLLLDAQHYDAAIAILESIGVASAPSRRQIRLAEAYTFRNQGDDRARGRVYFRHAARTARVGTGERTYALTRIAESFRRDAHVGRRGVLYTLSIATFARLVGFIDDPGGYQRARADSALGHTLLRMIEGLLADLPRHRRLRVVVSLMLTRAALSRQRAAARRSTGNRMAFIRQQTIELEALRSIMTNRALPSTCRWHLAQLSISYERAHDPRGVANIAAAEALLELADHHVRKAHEALNRADKLYGARADGRQDPSGAALVARRRKLLAGFGAARR